MLYIECVHTEVRNPGQDNESFVQYGETPLHETCHETTGDLYRALVKEYGRCVSKQYIDQDGKVVQVGWVFRKREEYGDSWRIKAGQPKTYLAEHWVTVHNNKPQVVVTHDYAAF